MHIFFFLKREALNLKLRDDSPLRYLSSIYYVLGNLLGTGKDKPEQSLLSVKLCVPRVSSLLFLRKIDSESTFEMFPDLRYHLRNLIMKTNTTVLTI